MKRGAHHLAISAVKDKASAILCCIGKLLIAGALTDKYFGVWSLTLSGLHFHAKNARSINNF